MVLQTIRDALDNGLCIPRRRVGGVGRVSPDRVRSGSGGRTSHKVNYRLDESSLLAEYGHRGSPFAKLVSGYSRQNRESKRVMILQAFVDDSRSATGGREYVLAGYMTAVPFWEKFSDDWSDVLAQHPPITVFHAVEAANLRGEFRDWSENDRDAKVLALARVVGRHPVLSFECRMNQVVFGRDLRPSCPYDLRSPYFFLFHSVMVTAARLAMEKGLGLPIDFVFDEQGNIGAEASLWYGPLKAMLPSSLRPYLGARPIFRDDKDVVPLQAADALAWHLRRSREERYKNERRDALNLLRAEWHAESYIPDEMLMDFAKKFRATRHIELTLQKTGSAKSSMVELETEIMKLPPEDCLAAYARFNASMDEIQKASPIEWELLLTQIEKWVEAGQNAKRLERQLRREKEEPK